MAHLAVCLLPLFQIASKFIFSCSSNLTFLFAQKGQFLLIVVLSSFGEGPLFARTAFGGAFQSTAMGGIGKSCIYIYKNPFICGIVIAVCIAA